MPKNICVFVANFLLPQKYKVKLSHHVPKFDYFAVAKRKDT